MKTFTLTFTIDDSLLSGGWENPYQLAIALKYALENRYAFRQVVDVQPVLKTTACKGVLHGEEIVLDRPVKRV